MKKISWLPLMAIIASCGTKESSLKGTFVNTSESDYSVATTTLTIDKATEKGKDLYIILKDVIYQRKVGKAVNGEDSLGKRETKPTEALSGKFYSDNNALYVTDLPNPFIISDDGAILTHGAVVYKRK